MSAPDFATSEAGGIQLQALHTLANLGWHYLTRAEGEAQRRGRLAETLLEDVLAERLRALNPLRQGNARHALPDEAAQEAVGRVRRAVADRGKGLLGGNAAVTDLLRLGTSVDVIVGAKVADDLPDVVRGDDFAAAVWRLLRETLAPIAGSDLDEVAAEAALAIAALVRAECRVGWQDDAGPKNAMRAGIDDYLYVEVKGRHRLWGLDAASMDRIADGVIGIARRQLAR